MRHDRVRDIIANTAREAGLTVEIEHNGGLGGKKRPGDICIQNWADGKDALVDVAIIHPTAKVHRSNLLNGLPGDAAQEHGKKQKHGKAAYKDLDKSKYILIAFCLETAGGVSPEARAFAKALEKKRQMRSCRGHEELKWADPNPMLTAINFEVQRMNATMILDREPPRIKAELNRYHHAVAAIAAESQKARDDLLEIKRTSDRTNPLTTTQPVIPIKKPETKTAPNPGHSANRKTNRSAGCTNKKTV